MIACQIQKGAMTVLEAQGSDSKDRERCIYRKTSDEWFDFYYCNKCYHKEKVVPRVCPGCGRDVIREDDIRKESL